MTWFRDRQRPLVLGHRGASALEVENTVAAFRAAIDAGADGVELDVRLCRSGEVVVFHDETLERLAGHPDRVADLSWDELKQISLDGGRRIPTLLQVLMALPTTCLVNVEVKTEKWSWPGRLVRATAEVVKRVGGDRVLVSSFDPKALVLMRQRSPETPRGLLCHQEQPAWLREARLWQLVSARAVHPQATLATSARVERWRRAGLASHVWTVDDVEQARHLARLGVDAIISNHPAALLGGLC